MFETTTSSYSATLILVQCHGKVQQGAVGLRTRRLYSLTRMCWAVRSRGASDKRAVSTRTWQAIPDARSTSGIRWDEYTDGLQFLTWSQVLRSVKNAIHYATIRARLDGTPDLFRIDTGEQCERIRREISSLHPNTISSVPGGE
jgi:hypothetical protein